MRSLTLVLSCLVLADELEVLGNAPVVITQSPREPVLDPWLGYNRSAGVYDSGGLPVLARRRSLGFAADENHAAAEPLVALQAESLELVSCKARGEFIGLLG